MVVLIAMVMVMLVMVIMATPNALLISGISGGGGSLSYPFFKKGDHRMKFITPVIKPVSTTCNIRCKYCYHEWNRELSKSVMTEDILLSIMTGLAKLKQPHMRFIWHGGEPTLAGIKFYEKVVKIQNSVFSNEQSITNSIQTNGVNINESWVDFFRTNNFNVGVSLDGPDYIHDSQRTLINGKGTFQRVLDSINLLRSGNVPIGTVCVVTKTSLPHVKEIFKFFHKEGIFRMNFLPTGDFDYDGQLSDYSLTPEEWGNFLIEIFNVWMETDDPRVKIHILDSFLQGLIGGKPNACVCRKDCTNFIAIDNQGLVFFCGRFMGNEEFLMGDITKESIYDIIDGDKSSSISQEVSRVKPECIGCNWLSICNGGCPNHRYFPNKSISDSYYFCKSTKIILNHMDSVLSKHNIN